jgi:carbon storage regulator
MIGDEIEVSVLSVTGEKVRLGITAPREVPVFRKEVYISIQAERAGEASSDSDQSTSEVGTRKPSNDQGGPRKASLARTQADRRSERS